MTGPSVIAAHQHPRRMELVEELHARPFQPMTAPGRVLRLAFKQPRGAAERDRAFDRAHLVALLDRHGLAHPGTDARQHSADLGGVRLKWESHTEFVSYLFSAEGTGDPIVDGLEASWISDGPGRIIAASEVELLVRAVANQRDALDPELLARFDPESFAASLILDGNAVVLGDFRIDPRGLARFAVVVTGQTGPRRLGRAVQRLLEMESYCTMALLGLPVARDTGAALNRIQAELTELTARATGDAADRPSDEDLLAGLSSLSAETEALAAAAAFRMNAAHAYATIVEDRVRLMREQPLSGRQQFGEFMTRRFDPAIRTIRATRERLDAIANRTSRLAQLIRTRVTVQLEIQNQQVLDQMNQRAALQLRLQETVEGLSVVAISYYAVSLAAYLLAPVAKSLGLDKPVLMALVTIPVIGAVWWFVRRIRNRVAKSDP